MSDDKPLVLIGDLACAQDGWFVGTTAVCFLSFRDRSSVNLDDLESVNTLIERYGRWASHLLYDFVAMQARTLVASAAGCNLEVPVQTPDASIELLDALPTNDDGPDEAERASDRRSGDSNDQQADTSPE